jgi:serine/threonine protein kinase
MNFLISEILDEASLLKKLTHPNIIRLYDSFVETEQLCIVMEYLEGGTLERFNAKNNLKTIKYIFSFRMILDRKGIKMGQDLALYYFTQVLI